MGCIEAFEIYKSGYALASSGTVTNEKLEDLPKDDNSQMPN